MLYLSNDIIIFASLKSLRNLPLEVNTRHCVELFQVAVRVGCLFTCAGDPGTSWGLGTPPQTVQNARVTFESPQN